MGRNRNRRKRTNFTDSLIMNNDSFILYYNRLKELAISIFKWNKTPLEIDTRYIELTLFDEAKTVWFKDTDADLYGCLSCLANGPFTMYGDPINRIARSNYNNYTKHLTNKDSVIIWNNLLRLSSENDIMLYAKRLFLIDRIIDINVNAQKTPVLIQGEENQQLTLKNLYMQYDGNAPVIYANKNLDLNSLSVLNTGAPFVAADLYDLKAKIWGEFLTYIGVPNTTYQKKERMVQDEVTREMGGTEASKYSRLDARKEAVLRINDMFGLDIEVDYREELVKNLQGKDIEDPDLLKTGGDDNE